MKIYLAGPMTKMPRLNFPAFDKAAKQLRAQGHIVFSPAEADRLEYGKSLKEIRKHANYRDCLRKDLNWILNHAEAIAILPGWKKSKGVKAEKALAEALKLPKIFL